MKGDNIMKKTIWNIIYNGWVRTVYSDVEITETEARKILKEQMSN
jgi:hypothetical protein